ncbi:hypothetical protein D3Z39_11140 [Anaerotruncus colihominis]|uniref:Uncharacterized protein n=1 Tax=Anaerotruncus colihominis TaxID=169435 RepID=A0A845RIR8_9FIRM|nr:hypothetical protein [Anaerotruncus colihominis]
MFSCRSQRIPCIRLIADETLAPLLIRHDSFPEEQAGKPANTEPGSGLKKPPSKGDPNRRLNAGAFAASWEELTQPFLKKR